MKNKTTAGVLAILVGGLGIHKFYLDRPIWGVVYLIFCWTFIPAILSFFEGLVYLVDSEEDFNKRYNPGYVAEVPDSIAKVLAEIQTNKTIIAEDYRMNKISREEYMQQLNYWNTEEQKVNKWKR